MDEPLDVELTATRWTRSRITCGMQSWSNVFRHGWDHRRPPELAKHFRWRIHVPVMVRRCCGLAYFEWDDPFWRGVAMFFLCDAWDGAIVWRVFLPGRRLVRWTLNNTKEWHVSWWLSLWWSWCREECQPV